MAVFPSEEWTKLYVEAINSSAVYKEAAATWEGDVTFAFEAEPEASLEEDVYGWFDLWHGECRQFKFGVSKEEAEAAKFVISAPYSRWKEIISKELDPIKGMMQGKIKVRGDLATIVRYVKASNVLVDLTSHVDTQFVDEV